MKDCLSSSIGDTSRIVQDSGELTKAWLKYALIICFKFLFVDRLGPTAILSLPQY